ncbi:uncharacterized protein LOC108602483 [Drosophila busckii]|uniref:uncharacterized protein LOC108602483 n=1 Tax=Drosophila busckii TaxID=30019 RepID=UPI00083F06B0|nr:uncharacterized protein LOC108602483 [Drosophila busckii]
MYPLQGKRIVLGLLALLSLLSLVAGSPIHGHRSERAGRTYSDIARVINPHPYAAIGSRVYPGQPFWSAGR